MYTKKVASILIIIFLFLSRCANTALASQSEDYLTGYLQGLFVYSYNLPSSAVKVKNGIVSIKKSQLNGYNPEQILTKVEQVVANLDGAKKVILIEEDEKQGAIEITKAETPKQEIIDGTMPGRSLFEPLIADPKWPRFTLAYQRFFVKGELKHVFAPNFGASFALYRFTNKDNDSQWELGIQAGLFGIMDIGHKQSALINADYFVGVPISYRKDQWSGLIKPYHISSHLGDEYMLTAEGRKTKRINLSYEGIDALLSYNFNGLRLYGGGGYLVNKDPSYIKPLKLQTGAEYYFANTFLDGRLRPITALDLKFEENNNWYPGISYKVGLQIENSALISHKLQLMLEYYSGRSFHGQFYRDKIRYLGIGLHGFL